MKLKTGITEVHSEMRKDVEIYTFKLETYKYQVSTQLSISSNYKESRKKCQLMFWRHYICISIGKGK
jgi:hypothetical protein